jgi:hypothetical protein
MTVATKKTARPLVVLAAAAAAGLTLGACAAEEPVALSAEQLTEALLTAGDMPVDGGAVIDVTSEETAVITAEYMSLTEAELEGADDACRAAFEEVYPAEGLTANTAGGNYGAEDESTLTVTLSSFHEQPDVDLGERYQRIGQACDGQTLLGDTGVGAVFYRLDSDGAHGFVMRSAGAAGGAGESGPFETTVLVEQRDNHLIEVIGQDMSEEQAVDVLHAQAEKLARAVDES